MKTAIDGNKTAEANNGWGIAPQFGRDHAARFELAAPLDSAKDRLLEFTLHQNFQDGQHSLGRFRISVTDAAPPLNFGLPPAINAILAKPADQRTDAERQALLAQAPPGRQALPGAASRVDRPTAAAAGRPACEGNRNPAGRGPAAAARRSQAPAVAPGRRAERGATQKQTITVAQDIVWALINNPAFLYNH